MPPSHHPLGVICEITQWLHPVPESITAAVCSFPSVDAAERTAVRIIHLGVPIARVDLLDANSVRAVDAHCGLGLKESPMLLMELHGSPSSTFEEAQRIRGIADAFGGANRDPSVFPDPPPAIGRRRSRRRRRGCGSFSRASGMARLRRGRRPRDESSLDSTPSSASRQVARQAELTRAQLVDRITGSGTEAA